MIFSGTKLAKRNLAFLQGDKSILIHRGGTRSGKTYNILVLLASVLAQGKKQTVSVVRKTLPSLRATAYRDFIEILENTEHEGVAFYSQVDHNKSELSFRFGDCLVEFFSIDNEQKVRSRKRDVLFICEANEITYREFQQLQFRTSNKTILDFNPDDPNIWIKTELEDKRAIIESDVEVIVSTYKDNTYLPKKLIKEIEYLEKTDPEFFKVFGLGQYGNISGRIFNWEVGKFEGQTLGYGLDFGFSIDPTALVEVAKKDGKVYIRELIYETGLTNKDIAKRIKDFGATNIIADSAEPKSIEEIKREGIRIIGAKKGPDSIRASIDILQGHELVVDPGSVNLLKELRSYKWLTDRNGDYIQKPVDRMNHAIDALRYFALAHLTNRKKGVYRII